MVLHDGRDAKDQPRYLLQIACHREGWRSAKHFISVHMTEQELVGLCFKAALQAMEHEVRANFRFTPEGGTAPLPIYEGHLDPNALHELVLQGRLQSRQGERVSS